MDCIFYRYSRSPEDILDLNKYLNFSCTISKLLSPKVFLPNSYFILSYAWNGGKKLINGKQDGIISLMSQSFLLFIPDKLLLKDCPGFQALVKQLRICNRGDDSTLW